MSAREQAVHRLAVTIVDGVGSRTDRKVEAERTELGDVQRTGGDVSIELQRTDDTRRADEFWWPSTLAPADLDDGDQVLVQAMGDHFFVLGAYVDGDEADVDGAEPRNLEARVKALEDLVGELQDAIEAMAA